MMKGRQTAAASPEATLIGDEVAFLLGMLEPPFYGCLSGLINYLGNHLRDTAELWLGIRIIKRASPGLTPRPQMLWVDLPFSAIL
jgi:hypothetical protein